MRALIGMSVGSVKPAILRVQYLLKDLLGEQLSRILHRMTDQLLHGYLLHLLQTFTINTLDKYQAAEAKAINKA